jgi:hypothetical protein
MSGQARVKKVLEGSLELPLACELLGASITRLLFVKETNLLIMKILDKWSIAYWVKELRELYICYYKQVDLCKELVLGLLQKESKDAQCTVAKESPVVDK